MNFLYVCLPEAVSESPAAKVKLTEPVANESFTIQAE